MIELTDRDIDAANYAPGVLPGAIGGLTADAIMRPHRHGRYPGYTQLTDEVLGLVAERDAAAERVRASDYGQVSAALDAAGLADLESLVGADFPTFKIMAEHGEILAELWQHPDGSHWCATRYVSGITQGTVSGPLVELAELVAGWTR